MNAAIKWGAILGIAVAILGFIFGATGMHTRPIAAFGFIAVAILLNALAVVLMLFANRGTAGWGAQVVNGLVLGLVAGVLVFLGSVLMTSVVFPDYHAEMVEGYRSGFEAMGLEPQAIEAAMADVESQTPASSALSGAIPTLITSIVFAGLGGIFLRKK